MLQRCIATLLIVLSVAGPILSAKILSIQATFKRNKDNHPVWDLSNATNGKAVILGPDKILSLNFCLRQNTNVMVHSFRFSNGNESEAVVVKIDQIMMGMFHTKKSLDHNWNKFESTVPFPMVPMLAIGWHQVTVEFNGTSDGIAVDKIDLTIDDDEITNDIFSCELACIPDQNYNVRANDALTESSFIVQESYKTACPEVDNINIPIFNPSVREYEITAVLPRYRTFSNWRTENTTGCPHLSPVYWSYNNMQITSTTKNVVRNEKSVLYFSEGNDVHSKLSLLMIFQFSLEGRSMGMIDSEMGTIFSVRFKHIPGNVRLTMRYRGRKPEISEPDVQLLTAGKTHAIWNTQDFAWSSQDYNLIFLYVDSNSTTNLEIQRLFLERRPILPDQVRTIHKTDDAIVEAVFSDFWWLRPDTMTVHLPNGETFANVSYFRIYRPIPWNSGYAQTFVLYQDGNARLLPVPPEGVDWIPFGSSVIIGQTDPTVVRPYASITDAVLDLQRHMIHVQYKDGGSAKLTLLSSLTETRVVVSDIYMARNPIQYPFTTFRSMYVAEGNNDVDHVSVNGIYATHIMRDFGTLMGRSFVFHRKCMSRHLNLSPDIYIDIRRTTNTATTTPLMEIDSFQSLFQRIQNHRYRLWTPRLRN